LTLRSWLLLGVAVALVVSLMLVRQGVAPGWWLLINSAVLAAALVFERRGYRPRAADPAALRRTGERFHDPTTGELLEVWEDPHTGSREYRPTA
jgi:hypothetical protein